MEIKNVRFYFIVSIYYIHFIILYQFDSEKNYIEAVYKTWKKNQLIK